MIYSITLNPSIDYIVRLDEFREGKLNRSMGEYVNVGGKGIMVSKLLTNIGVENKALGFLGGFTGEYIYSWFKYQGMKEDFTKVEENTRINVKIKDNQESEINGKGPSISTEEEKNFLNKLAQLKKGDTVIISGSAAPGLSKDIFGQIIKICKDKGADFVIDTSGHALKKAIELNPLLIKPNFDEVSELFGQEFASKEEIIPYGKKCLDMGAQYVIVSMGGEGALFFDGDQVYYAPVVKGILVNSVGAGDSMLAGFVGSIKSGLEPLEAFKWSVASGTATAFCQDIATKEQIDEIYKKIKIEKL
nr:1-phosphofructokinase [uncultured Peptostreptococcus sp.]